MDRRHLGVNSLSRPQLKTKKKQKIMALIMNFINSIKPNNVKGESKVSEEIEIFKQINNQAGLDSGKAQSKEEGLYAAQSKRCSKMTVVLGRKRFDLVLDDQIWDGLKILFTHFTAAGGRVLITTRNEQLPRQMRAIYNHVMEGSEECSSPPILESELLTDGKIAREEFTEAAWQAISSTHGKKRTQQTAYLVRALLEQKNGDAHQIFSKARVDNTRLLEAINQYIKTQINVGEASGSKQGTTLEDLIKRARKFKKYGDPLVSVGHLLLAFKGDMSFGAQVFNDFNIYINNLQSAIHQDRKALDRYGMDLTAKAKAGKIDPIIGRDTEIESCMEILLMKRNGNPVLIGDPGVGKTAIVEGLAQRMVEGAVPQGLQNCKLISLDIGALNSETKNREDLMNRLKDVLGEVTESDGHMVIFIDEIHMIVGAGGPNGTTDVSNLLKPKLDGGQLHCIGATTIAEFRKHIERHPALKSRFQPVNVKEATVEDTISILGGLRERYEHHHGVCISDNALVHAAQLSHRYIREGFLPDKAIVLIDRAAASLKMELISKPTILTEMEPFPHAIDIEVNLSSIQAGFTVQLSHENILNEIDGENMEIQQEEKEVTSNDIAKIVSKQTGIPLTKLLQSEKEKLLKLEEELHKQVIGQDYAVNSVAMAIKRSRSGLSDPHRPIASLMFMGPTGVGKTELAKALALYMFNTEEALVRFDMSEYMENHTVSRLIGAPPGYISCENGGQLTEKVRERPYSVILFDEIEKAHSDVLNVFLQILDDGRVTDSLGRTVSFTNTIIIMTSNVGSEDILSKDIDYETIKQKVVLAAKSFFKPEFRNRVDEWIIFHPLDHKQINIIVQLQLEKLQERMSDRKIKIQATDAAVEQLGNLGYDHNYGARPVKRVIQQMVVNEIADLLLKDEFKDEDTILIDVASSSHQLPQQKLTFRKLNSDTGPHSEYE
ncbi:hypothetical protein QJS10_CPA05g01809 [Acorus calamus]|uniref:Clp R domain-containing protein n=1 Tax=Acorus calamus TaxID=4465 RepID=A0AAV9EVN7_ACOCL|nr:hypothetical protein QJS10_CPA05g01809 [Acorus calamus]